MVQQTFLAIIGFGSGVIIAGGVTGLLIGLAIFPRYAGITHTASHLLLYEDCVFLGALAGTIVGIYHIPIPLGSLFLSAYGFFSGMYLGGWILALSEIADIFPIFARRLHLTKGFSIILITIAAGKTIGSLFYYYLGWS